MILLNYGVNELTVNNYTAKLYQFGGHGLINPLPNIFGCFQRINHIYNII